MASPTLAAIKSHGTWSPRASADDEDPIDPGRQSQRLRVAHVPAASKLQAAADPGGGRPRQGGIDRAAGIGDEHDVSAADLGQQPRPPPPTEVASASRPPSRLAPGRAPWTASLMVSVPPTTRVVPIFSDPSASDRDGGHAVPSP